MNGLTTAPNQTPAEEVLIGTPQLIDVPAQTFAMIPLCVPVFEVGMALVAAFKELEQAVEQQGILQDTPFFTHHLRMPVTHYALEACIPTTVAVMPTGRVLGGTWPAGTVARVSYFGAYEYLTAAWHEFFSWLGSNNHTPDLSRVYEQYVVTSHDHEDPKCWQTDLNVGIA